MLSALYIKGNLSLVHRSLYEECLSWCQDVAIIYRRICLVGAIVHIPYGDRCGEVEVSGIEVGWIWVAEEVPATVVGELSHIFFHCHLLVGRCEDAVLVAIILCCELEDDSLVP